MTADSRTPPEPHDSQHLLSPAPQHHSTPPEVRLLDPNTGLFFPTAVGVGDSLGCALATPRLCPHGSARPSALSAGRPGRRAGGVRQFPARARTGAAEPQDRLPARFLRAGVPVPPQLQGSLVGWAMVSFYPQLGFCDHNKMYHSCFRKPNQTKQNKTKTDRKALRY